MTELLIAHLMIHLIQKYGCDFKELRCDEQPSESIKLNLIRILLDLCMFVEPVHNAHTNKKKCIVIFVGENSENMSQPVDHVSPQIL